MKHYFLGLASDYTRDMRRKQLFSHGKKSDYLKLKDYILKEYGLDQVLITRNGRSAIAAGLKYYFRGKTGEIIVNGLTCYAVIQGIKAAGMKPVYADVDLETLNFTPDSIKKALTKDTRGIMVQNNLGNMINIDEIEKIAKKNNLIILEDLAHCTGKYYSDGREAGTVGQIAIFTFGKDKTIDVVNGGAVAFRSGGIEDLKEPTLRPPFSEVLRARLYPTLGAICRGLSYVRLGGVFMRFLLKIGLVKKSADGDIDFTDRRLSYFQSKLALEQLKHRKQNNAKLLRSFYLVDNRSEVLKKLRKAGYYFDGFWYDTPVMPRRYYKKARFPENECPKAVFASKHIVNLPNYYKKEELAKAKKIILENLVEDKK